VIQTTCAVPRMTRVAAPVLVTHVGDGGLWALHLDLERRNQRVLRVDGDVTGPAIKLEADRELHARSSIPGNQ